MGQAPDETSDNESMEDVLRLHSVEPEDQDDLDEDEGVSLEDISRTYVDVVSQADADAEVEADSEASDDEESEASDELLCPITPQSIVESILFVGRADGEPIPATDLAAIMRGVTVEEIASIVAELNEQFQKEQRALTIAEEPAGYRITLAEDLASIKERFYGPTREVRLNQAAIDCLALIAYQPGIERDEIEKQRGQASGSVLSQLVRRELVEIRRESSAEDPKKRPHYYPTPKLFELTGISSLDDLPQVEEPS